jgi:hypothetical protein
MTKNQRVLQASVREWTAIRDTYRRPTTPLDKLIAKETEGRGPDDIVRIALTPDQVDVLFQLGVL